MTMKANPMTTAACAFAAIFSNTLATAKGQEEKPDSPRIQLAIVLDTSSSMDGLIEQAKSQLWKIINTFIAAKQDGRAPYVEVALYEYGNDGLAEAKSLNQVEQDANASTKATGGAMVQRAVAKASQNYHNSAWDLVDASKEKGFDITKLDKNDLPKEMQEMDDTAKLAFIDTKAKERADIQGRILDLNKKRDAFVAEKRRDQAGAGKDTLDEVVTGTVRKQAASKGLKFE
jgi:hypothetical protein